MKLRKAVSRILIFIVLVASTFVLAPTEVDAVTINNNSKVIWDFLKGKGFNDYAVAGIMGNLYAESALIPNNLEN